MTVRAAYQLGMDARSAALVVALLVCTDAMAIKEKAIASQATEVEQPALEHELRDMVRVDQETLQRFYAGDKAAEYAWHIRVQRHAVRMQQIIDAYGWPTRRMVGKIGSYAAWLLIQHADDDVDFQQRSLVLLDRAVMEGDADPENLAYLTDRVRTNQHRNQLYGTQFEMAVGGCRPQPNPIEDADKVDERRANLGMSTLASYLNLASKLCSGQTVEKNRKR